MPSQPYAEYFASLDATVKTLIAGLASINSNALLVTARQNIQAGFTETEVNLGTPANGTTITLDPLNGLKQTLTNNVSGFTIQAPADIGDIELRIVNGATAGAIAFTGFTKQFTGDGLDTTTGHQFEVFIYGFGGGKSAYLIKALQ